MPKVMTLPELGENIEIVDVVGVLVQPGDILHDKQSVIEVETEKAVIEVPSSVIGTVTKVLTKVGDRVRPGAPILEVEEGNATTTAPEATVTSTTTGTSTQADVQLHQAPATRESRSTDPHEPAKPATTPPTTPSAATEFPATSLEGGPVKGPASPSVRRFAREIGVALAAVHGSGPGGRISIDDVKAHARHVHATPALALGGPTTLPLPDLARFGPVIREPIGNVRRTTAEHVARSWAQIPHVTHHDSADITDLEKLRARHAPDVAARGGKLTLTAIVIKVVAKALRHFPRFNASLDTEHGELCLRQYVHIGIAVDTERGLLVPVIRDADHKNLVDLALELGALSEKARERRLTPEEFQGAGFTISNLGGIGGQAFTPIIEWPQVAILGMSRTSRKPVWIDGAFQPRDLLPLSLSYDHRVIDGADAARFLRWVATALADQTEE